MLPALRKMPFILEAHYHYQEQGEHYYACKFHPEWNTDRIFEIFKSVDVRQLFRVRGDDKSEFAYIGRL